MSRNMSVMVVDVLNGGALVEFRIFTQTHRGKDFNPGGPCRGREFAATNGWSLYSAECPELDVSDRTLYVRGGLTSHDNDILKTSKENYYKILEAITQYNKHHHQPTSTDPHPLRPTVGGGKVKKIKVDQEYTGPKATFPVKCKDCGQEAGYVKMLGKYCIDCQDKRTGVLSTADKLFKKL